MFHFHVHPVFEICAYFRATGMPVSVLNSYQKYVVGIPISENFQVKK